MNKTTTPVNSLDALRRLCETYGGDVACWPADKRAAYGDLFASDEASEIRLEAQSLDAVLKSASAPSMDENLQPRILADFDAHLRADRAGATGIIAEIKAIIASRISLRRLAPASLLAGLGVMGLASGMMTVSAQMPEAEALSYLEDGLAYSTLNEEGALEWDAD